MKVRIYRKIEGFCNSGFRNFQFRGYVLTCSIPAYRIRYQKPIKHSEYSPAVPPCQQFGKTPVNIKRIHIYYNML